MKVKELAARNYSGTRDDSIHAYLAGFENARKLCAEAMAPFLLKMSWEGYFPASPGFYSKGESEARSLSDILLEIGEHEA